MGCHDGPLLVVAPVGVDPFIVLVREEVGRADFQRPPVLDQCLIALRALGPREVRIEGVHVRPEQPRPQRVPLTGGDEDLAFKLRDRPAEGATDLAGC